MPLISAYMNDGIQHHAYHDYFKKCVINYLLSLTLKKPSKIAVKNTGLYIFNDNFSCILYLF